MTALVSAFERVTEVRDEWIELSDGCRLFARIVLPVDADADPVPAVLEFLPYRLTDGTAHRDATHHPYWAGHGYAGVRVDMRGSGNSEGVLEDEYLPQEQADACEVIAWLAVQAWCSGSVGMYGKSWGGFNALQVASHRPPALKAVISAYFTDDRYADDVHYMGGCVLAHEALSWASYMLGLGALPPDPAYVGDRWRELWLARLREQPVFLETWLSHQRRDELWRQGSICEDFAALDCGVLLVGGWADGYTNGVDRALAGLDGAGVPCRGIVGPWSHSWPEVSRPAPRIGFLQEAVRWWDHWLKGADNGAMDEPMLRAWIQDAIVPATRHELRPGRWVASRKWPSPHLSARRLYPSVAGGLSASGPRAGRRLHVGDPLCGSEAGAWCPYGRPTDFPPDQRGEDGRSLTFTTEPLPEPLEILGRPTVALELSVDRPLALVAARLCDVSPEGRSLLVSRGLLNLTHRDGHDRVVALVPGEPVVVQFPLDFAGHRFAAGHAVRLALSPTYWPFAWPSPEPVTLDVRLGEQTYVSLPERDAGADDGPPVRFGEPERAAPAAGGTEIADERTLTTDLSSGEIRSTVVSDERSHLADTGLWFGERQQSSHVLPVGDPRGARLEYHAEHHLRRGEWQIRVLVSTSLTADAEAFTVSSELDAYEGRVRVHALRRSVRIPRDGN
ncbi:MAG TPA: CocE/NonD family hydrolase [Solirubrobacteraceae bacterium]|nr:CocE/NonD family hydrolase [Solirubrobacteraceae bacterium]